MKQLALWFGLVFAVACGGKQGGANEAGGLPSNEAPDGAGAEPGAGEAAPTASSGAPTSNEDAFAGLETMANELCACSNLECVYAVQARLESDQSLAGRTLSGDDQIRLYRLGKWTAACESDIAARADVDPAAGLSAELALRDYVDMGVPECDALVKDYIGCDKLPQQSRDAFLQGVDAWKQSIAAGGDAARTALAESCVQAAEASVYALEAVGCSVQSSGTTTETETKPKKKKKKKGKKK